MQEILEVVEDTVDNRIQDLSRYGYHYIVISFSACLNPFLSRVANALVSNDADSADIAIQVLKPTLSLTESRLQVALA